MTYALVINRVTQTSVDVLVGGLFATLRKPERARLRVFLRGSEVGDKDIKTWGCAGPKLCNRFVETVHFSGLEPNESYTVVFEADKVTRRGKFRTLPASIPMAPDAFTIASGSCFYPHKDGGQAAEAYKMLYELAPPADSPDVTFLLGDQVYLDLGIDSLLLRPSKISERIADDYAVAFEQLGSLLSRGGTWMLPDDHEYWNDYPFNDSWWPNLLAVKIAGVRRHWKAVASAYVKNVQRAVLVETVSIGDDLSICLADTRTLRTRHGFLPHDDFQKVIQWAEGLTGPGVLALPEPLIVDLPGKEYTLRSFSEQYKALLDAIGKSGHDVILLAGDAHYGRLAVVSVGKGRLIEVISSPLSNLTGLNGFFTEVSNQQPFSLNGKDVAYQRHVSFLEADLLRGYPRDRTKEHFITSAFSRNADDMTLTVKCWLVREREEGGLPAAGFDAYTMRIA